MSAVLSMRQRLFWLGLVTAFWVLLAMIIATQMALGGPFSWNQALRFALSIWGPWILLSPAVLWLARRFPFEIGHWKWSVPIHLLACLVVMGACELIARSLSPRFGPPPDRPGLRFLGPPPERLPGMNPPRHIPPPEPRSSPPTNAVGARPNVGNSRLPFDAPARFGEGPGRRPPGLGPEGPGRFRGRGGRGPGPLSLRDILMRANSAVPIYCLLVSLSHAFTYFGRSRERERQTLELEARLAQAKLQALRMQLHPHFLFNTLHAISTLVHKNPVAADEMIGNLSELLRLTIEEAEQQEVPLRQELEFLDRYLEIQQVRFGDRLRVERQIDDQVLAAQVPSMILQPLVENAIRHGIEPQPTPGIISLVASRVGEHLALSVADTGVGAKSPAQPLARAGIGLSNTRARLQELYGANHRLTLRNGPSSGFEVQLEIPYHEQPLKIA